MLLSANLEDAFVILKVRWGIYKNTRPTEITKSTHTNGLHLRREGLRKAVLDPPAIALNPLEGRTMGPIRSPTPLRGGGSSTLCTGCIWGV